MQCLGLSGGQLAGSQPTGFKVCLSVGRALGALFNLRV